MNTGKNLINNILEREQKAWDDLGPQQYDQLVCEMLAEISEETGMEASGNNLMMLSGVTLRRISDTVTESRFRCAEQLLKHGSTISGSTFNERIYLLFLLAWLQLGVVIKSGPQSISVTADLPEGSALPNGADPSHIKDPVLYHQALEAAERHTRKVQLWNAKQRALAHLSRLATLVLADPGVKESGSVFNELLIAMSLAPGVPATLQNSLQNRSQ